MLPFYRPLLLLVLVSRLLPPQSVVAQTPYFLTRYPDPGGRQSYLGDVIATDSGFVAAASVNHYGAGNWRAQQLRALTPDGQTRWLRTYSRANAEYNSGFPSSLVAATGGRGYVLAGTMGASAWARAMLWRFKANGDTLWTRRYNDSTAAKTIGYGSCRTLDGGYVLNGTVYQAAPTLPGGYRWLALLVRVDSAGRRVWQRTYAAGTEDRTTGLQVVALADGGFVVSGLVCTPATDSTARAYVFKVDGAGDVVWERQWGDHRTWNTANAPLLLASGDILVAGTQGAQLRNRYGRGRQQVTVLAPDGTLRWQRTLGPERSSPEPLRALALADGSLVVGGRYNDTLGRGFEPGEAYLYKLCPNGDSVWWRTYQALTGPSSRNYMSSFCATPDGGVVGTGYLFAVSPDPGPSDGWAFRVDSLGYLQAGGAPAWIHCPRPVSGLAPAGAAEAVRVYPNPSADGRFTLAGAGGAEAVVVDALGRVVRRAAAASPEQPLDLSGAPPGLYLLRLRWADGRAVTAKLVR